MTEIPAGIAAIPAATLLGAIAFAGAGGAMNLTQSNRVRDKGIGMRARLPKIVSPFTGRRRPRPRPATSSPATTPRWTGRGRLWAVAWAVLFYGGFSLFTVSDQLTKLFA